MGGSYAQAVRIIRCMHMAFAGDIITILNFHSPKFFKVGYVHAVLSAIGSLHHGVCSQKVIIVMPRYPDVRSITTGYSSRELGTMALRGVPTDIDKLLVGSVMPENSPYRGAAWSV